jgi:hypothetical protein
MITALATDGDPMARGALAELVCWLGFGLAQVGIVLDRAWCFIGA